MIAISYFHLFYFELMSKTQYFHRVLTMTFTGYWQRLSQGTKNLKSTYKLCSVLRNIVCDIWVFVHFRLQVRGVFVELLQTFSHLLLKRWILLKSQLFYMKIVIIQIQHLLSRIIGIVASLRKICIFLIGKVYKISKLRHQNKQK